MNKELRRVSVAVLVMFLALFGSSTVIQVFQQDTLKADSRNTRTLYASFSAERGPILVDGQPMRSCLMFAVSAQPHEVTTVEGIGHDPEHLSPVQQAFAECHGLQCGFCTPGFVTTITAFIEENPDPTLDEAREAISGNLCRCTGYQNICKAVVRAAEIKRERATADGTTEAPEAGDRA